MSFKIAAAAATLATLISSVSAHGYVQTLDVGGKFFYNYNTTLQYQNPVPESIGWSDPEDQDNGYISDYTSPDIICHKAATNAKLYAPIAAGENVTFTWNTWPDSHKGPVITYLANCNGDCTTVDKTTLKFFKIDEGGLISASSTAGNGGSWATDELIADNFSWSSKIPASIAAGNYVVRHEIIALHSAENAGGAQNYPQCMNLKITSSGTDNPEGVLGEKLYTSTDKGILVNIYNGLTSYVIPGPALYTGGASSGTASSAAASVASSSAVVASSSAVVASSSAVVASSSAAVVASSSVVATSAAQVASSSYVQTTAAPVQTSAVASANNDVVTATATDIVTAKAYTTVTAVASLASELPSDALTSTIATAVPTATASGSAALPTKALPEGTTLEDLLKWVDYLFTEYFEEQDASSSKQQRRHARDISVARK